MNTRFLIVIIVFTLLLLPSTSCTNLPNPTATPTPTLTYENSAYGVKINYPQDWKKREGDRKGIVVEFIRPAESASDNRRESCGIKVKDVPSSMTLDDYALIETQNIGLVSRDYNIIDFSPTTLAGNPAQKIVFTAKLGSYDLKGLHVYTIKNNKIYIVGYMGQSDRYSDFIGIVQQMIDSFEITPSTGQ